MISPRRVALGILATVVLCVVTMPSVATTQAARPIPGGTAPSPAPSPNTRLVHLTGHVVALLSGAVVARIDLDSGRVTTRSLGDSTQWWSGWSIGHDAARDTVYVALVNKRDPTTQLFALSARTLAPRIVPTLRDSMEHGWIRTGERTGRVYALSSSGFRGVSLDPSSGAIVSHFESGRDHEHFRDVFWFEIDRAETHLFVSYHGQASGVDWATLHGDSMVACSPPSGARTTCVDSHGGVVPFRGGLVAAAGGSVVQAGLNGEPESRLPTGLPGLNHFMELAVDERAGLAYNVGSCLSAGGLASTDLDGRLGRTLPGNREVCGSHIVISADGALLAVVAGRVIDIVDA